MQNNIHKSSLMALAVVSALGVSSFASAQMLEEVIVTAQRKAETLTEAPVAVSLVSGQDLNDLSIFQADELNKLVTGMEVRYEGDSNTGVGLRGVGTFSQQPTPARVGTYMDDFFMSAQAAAALGNMYDMSNIQILKGPQGTLYGQPSPTGALILTTQDPNFDGVNGHIRGSYMDPNGYNVQGAINFPITETLAVRIAGLTDQRETGVEVKRDETVNPLSSLDEERNLDAIRVKLLWEPSETFSAKLGYHYLESKDSDTYKVVETIDPATANYKDLKADDRIAIADNADEMIDSESTIVTLHLNWMIGDVEVKWFSGMMESLKDSISDEDITDVPEVILAVDTEFGKGGRSDQHELRVSSTAFDIWDWTFGAYYAESWAQTYVTAYQHIFNVGVFPFNLDIPNKTYTKALFTHNAFALSENTELTVGARYNNFKASAGNIQSGDFWFGSEILPGGEITEPSGILENAFPCVDGSTPPCELGSKYDETEWTGTVKLSHFFSDELKVYGTIDRGYRPGTANFDTSGVFTPEFNTYGGESVNSIEIGAKGELFDGRARYTAAIFRSEYEDYQVKAFFDAYNLIKEEVEHGSNNAPWINVDEAVQQGIEADFRMMVTDQWMLYGGFSYAEVEFTDGEIPCTDPSQPPLGPDNRFNTCDADGGVASAQPEWTGVLQSEYTFPQVFAEADAYLGALWSYRGDIEVPGDTIGRLESDDFSTLDLFAGLRADDWTLQLFAKNVTDDDGITSKRPVGTTYNALTVTAPRTVGVTASYTF